MKMLVLWAIVSSMGLLEVAGAVGSELCDMIEAPVFYCNCLKTTETDKPISVVCNVFKHSSLDDQAWDIFHDENDLEDLELNSRDTTMTFIPVNVFSYLPGLKGFKLRFGKIPTIPQRAISKMKHLEVMNLAENEIEVLQHESFFDLPNLFTIQLSGNLLTAVNKSVFVDLPRLRNLFLDHNQIGEIKDRAFKKLHNLHELDLSKNKLKVLTKDTLSGLKSLRFLNLASNMIEHISSGVFRELKSLDSLNLNYNRISSIENNAFKDLHMMTTLNLLGNQLKTFGDVFGGVKRLYFIDLRENLLETIPKSAVQSIWVNLVNQSMQLYISDNPFICSCAMSWIPELYVDSFSLFLKKNLEQVDCEMAKSDVTVKTKLMNYVSDICSGLTDLTETEIHRTHKIGSVEATRAPVTLTTEVELPSADTHSPSDSSPDPHSSPDMPEPKYPAHEFHLSESTAQEVTTVKDDNSASSLQVSSLVVLLLFINMVRTYL